MIALLAAGWALAAEVQLTESVLRIDGLVVMDVVKERTGAGVSWMLVREGAPALHIERVKGLEGKYYHTVTLHPELDRFQGDFTLDETALIERMVREGVIAWGAVDRQAFGAFADARGLVLENVNDRSRQTAITLDNRCTLDAVVTVRSARATGRTVEVVHTQAPRSSTRLDVHTGDRACLTGLNRREFPGEPVCVDLSAGTRMVQVGVDCKRFTASAGTP